MPARPPIDAIGSALVVLGALLMACAPSPQAPVAPRLHEAVDRFSRDRLCPAGRVTLRERPDISTKRVGVVAAKYEALPSVPPPEVAADPERLRLWTARLQEADKEAARWHIEQTTGCGESAVYAYRTSEWRARDVSCLPFKEVSTLAELLANPPHEEESVRTAAEEERQRVVAESEEATRRFRIPLLRACGGDTYELEVRAVGDCTLRMHTGASDSRLIAELGRPCALPTRKSQVAVPLRLVAATAELTGDLLELKVSATDPDKDPVTFHMTTRMERAAATASCRGN
jgi:hypothetical protein